jgi:hypothetical protein
VYVRANEVTRIGNILSLYFHTTDNISDPDRNSPKEVQPSLVLLLWPEQTVTTRQPSLITRAAHTLYSPATVLDDTQTTQDATRGDNDYY